MTSSHLTVTLCTIIMVVRYDFTHRMLPRLDFLHIQSSSLQGSETQPTGWHDMHSCRVAEWSASLHRVNLCMWVDLHASAELAQVLG
jgi:hypothetical protein